jgi:integrase
MFLPFVSLVELLEETTPAFAGPSRLRDDHGLRYELFDRNPVQWVRQSAKRKKIPVVLEIEEVKSLLSVLDLRERTMVLLDVVTGLRGSELFALKWTNINFNRNEISVTRSIVM